ncbi:MAG: undecaprenyldiphospho-muramoylpentapeptide beta-N-acetylglucosaminyltransferase [Bacteroidetes bacterium]|jgi:UDP-N-acetylglucosamine--N-acetylmuramyl-(pentapeptide) pyrophosphoryl-undecaprenol N-acetylglucosamine transferase|nr:undecaprenyldiphospho-muramoylpentapeptide beta-N-acetylglucosaminyltransferase [Bacteroidota bacterium]
MATTLRVALAGGGTGGHLYPAIAVAEALKERRPDAEFLFFGTSGKIEARVVPAKGYPFASIWISGFHRSLRPGNLLFPVKVVVSLWQSWRALGRFRPLVVVGTGGYVCGPVLAVASWMGIPTVVHESNAYPGMTTRLLASRVDRLLVSFEDTKRWLSPTDHVTVVGTPVRKGLGTADRSAARAQFGLDAARATVLIVGGSLGASSINRTVAASAEAIRAAGLQLIWQTGRTDEADLTERFGKAGVGRVTGFIEDMDAAYAAADLVVARAGASTLAELTAIGKASVLVPYPHAAADHQTKNARSMEAAGAAIVVPDKDVMERLAPEVLKLANDPARRREMELAARQLGKPRAADTIAEMVLDLL